MNTAERIRTALAGLGEPVQANTYRPADSSERYFTFNLSSFGTDYADDAPGHERVLIMLHYYCPTAYDTTALVRQVKRLLFAADFTWPAVTNAGDADRQHIVFEFEEAVGVTPWPV